MPVETGFTPDEEAEAMLAEADRETGAQPPPAEIAGAEALEPSSDRSIDVRGRTFQLIDGEIPGMLITKLSNAQVAAQRSPNSNEKQMEAMSAIHQAIVFLVDDKERAEFEDHCMAVTPPLGMKELMDLMGVMLAKVTGRPTQLSSVSGAG